jgi:hypothetical protein
MANSLKTRGGMMLFLKKDGGPGMEDAKHIEKHTL